MAKVILRRTVSHLFSRDSIIGLPLLIVIAFSFSYISLEAHAAKYTAASASPSGSVKHASRATLPPLKFVSPSMLPTIKPDNAIVATNNTGSTPPGLTGVPNKVRAYTPRPSAAPVNSALQAPLQTVQPRTNAALLQLPNSLISTPVIKSPLGSL